MDKRIIFHVDCNSAFLSFSAVRRLQLGIDTIDLRTIPSVIAGSQASRHGIILAKSIPTKPFGIKTGEPLVDALKKYPKLTVVPPDYYCYEKCNKAMNEILREYSDKVQIFSIDESFLDMTNTYKLFGDDPIAVATIIKDRIKNELGFTVSVGISSNKLLSKQASEFRKPDAVSTCFTEEIPKKLWPLPIRELYMCGEATEKKLLSIGITTIGDLANFDIEFIKYKLKPAWGTMLWSFAHGVEDSPVKPGNSSVPKIKGIGNSSTIRFDVTDKADAYKVLLSLVEMVAMRLRSHDFCCKLVSVWIRTNELIGYSHQKKLYVPTDSTNKIYKTACLLFDESWKKEPIRALGVRVSDLCSNDFIQLSLFEDNSEKKRKIDKVIDQIRMEYGSHSVFRSCFLWSGISSMSGGIMEEENNFVMSSIL